MFVGRKELLRKLASLWHKETPSLVTCRGRRRIGKSTLVHEFATKYAEKFIAIDGQAPGTGINNETQLASFAEQLSMQSNVPNIVPASWLQAFQLLDTAIPPKGKTVVLLDEISWIGGYDNAFPGTLKIAWDKMLSRHRQLIVVLCGSVSAWIARNILHGTGFAGRASLDLVVEELPLEDCLSFWHRAASRVSLQEKLDLLSVTGGIPKYLEEIDSSLSADANIRNLCFSPEGMLFRDFNQIFHDIFGTRTVIRKSMMKALAKGPLTLSEIAEKMDLERSGNLSAYLEELELSGFIAKDTWVNPRTGKLARQARYRLKDNYSRFYLHYVEPRAEEIRKGLYQFTSLENLPGWQTILGLQFENLVVNNYAKLLPLIGLEGVSLLSASPCHVSATKQRQGCQIDLLLQTRKSVYVVEVKRQRHIGYEVVDEVNRKIRCLPVTSRTSTRTVLVYDGELSPKIRTENCFDFLVPVERLFGLT